MTQCKCHYWPDGLWGKRNKTVPCSRWGASHHYAVAGEVVHAWPSADVPGARVRRPAAAVPDNAGQHVADAGPTPSVTEARDSDTASHETRSRSDWHRQLSASVESDLHVEGHWTSGSQSAQHVAYLSANCLMPRISQRTERSTRPKQPCYASGLTCWRRLMCRRWHCLACSTSQRR